MLDGRLKSGRSHTPTRSRQGAAACSPRTQPRRSTCMASTAWKVRRRREGRLTWRRPAKVRRRVFGRLAGARALRPAWSPLLRGPLAGAPQQQRWRRRTSSLHHRRVVGRLCGICTRLQPQDVVLDQHPGVGDLAAPAGLLGGRGGWRRPTLGRGRALLGLAAATPALICVRGRALLRLAAAPPGVLLLALGMLGGRHAGASGQRWPQHARHLRQRGQRLAAAGGQHGCSRAKGVCLRPAPAPSMCGAGCSTRFS